MGNENLEQNVLYMNMKVRNAAIAEVFNDIADLLEIKGENPFRIRAYRNASRTIGSISQDIADMVANGEKLSEIPGIGKDLAAKIREIVETGRLQYLDDLEKELSPELIRLMHITGLGGKRVGVLYNKLGINNIDDLEKAAKKQKIRELKGFGEKIEKNIIEGIRQSKEAIERIPWINAEMVAVSFREYFAAIKEIEYLEIAGSFRRCKETVRDLDILVVCSKPQHVIQKFVSFPKKAKIVSQGDTRSTIMLQSGVQVDIRVVSKESYGAALHYFTGSQAHNIAIRKRGVKRNLKINEYGIFRENKYTGGASEDDVFKAVDLPFIPPELREDNGEIEAAENRTLPILVEEGNIRGDLHVHTNRTDGRDDLETMAKTAKARGYEYIAICDHSQRLAMAHGLHPDDLRRQIELIDKLNEKQKRFTLLKSIEVDILEDGTLDLPDSVLEELDLTVCSIHSRFNLPREKQTERIIRAMENPYFTILGHPTGRIVNRRVPYEIDMEKIMKKAKEYGCFLEVNANPERMDLNDVHCRMAKEHGIQLAISTDAHGADDYNFMRIGVAQARRGWIEGANVLNTKSLAELKKHLKRKR